MTEIPRRKRRYSCNAHLSDAIQILVSETNKDTFFLNEIQVWKLHCSLCNAIAPHEIVEILDTDEIKTKDDKE
jgi:hypothetical protein